MALDAAPYRCHPGQPSVVPVNDPLDAIRDVVAGYRVVWLILERDVACRLHPRYSTATIRTGLELRQ